MENNKKQNVCAACINLQNNVKTRINVPHTCNKKEIIKTNGRFHGKQIKESPSEMLSQLIYSHCNKAMRNCEPQDNKILVPFYFLVMLGEEMNRLMNVEPIDFNKVPKCKFQNYEIEIGYEGNALVMYHKEFTLYFHETGRTTMNVQTNEIDEKLITYITNKQ